ncbi:50S ribosomal protein L5 [Candidatus Babeliales bacterium]|nr:50S ribosomal protein L5 [Candidatus Babeliales bacterium]
MKSRLKRIYQEELKKQLQESLKLKNIMQVPRIEKIVLNVGVKDAVSDSKVLQGVKDVIEIISGQRAVKTYARKSIASFKLREGMAIGVRVTLRDKNMYNFLDRLVHIALPSVRDFNGVSVRFDGTGNYNVGIKDWMIFPELDYDKMDKSRGMNITIHTSTSNDTEAFALLKAFGMPFRAQ